MISYKRIACIFTCLLIASLCLGSCAKKKEGKVIVTEQNFTIRQDEGFNWVIDAHGKIRNVGDADVKKVVVTGYCRSCGEVLTAGVWYINNVPKTSEQKDVISYLPAGDEAEFNFREIAFYFNQKTGQGPKGLPEKLEVVVKSFETVQE